MASIIYCKSILKIVFFLNSFLFNSFMDILEAFDSNLIYDLSFIEMEPDNNNTFMIRLVFLMEITSIIFLASASYLTKKVDTKKLISI